MVVAEGKTQYSISVNLTFHLDGLDGLVTGMYIEDVDVNAIHAMIAEKTEAYIDSVRNSEAWIGSVDGPNTRVNVVFA